MKRLLLFGSSAVLCGLLVLRCESSQQPLAPMEGSRSPTLEALMKLKDPANFGGGEISLSLPKATEGRRLALADPPSWDGTFGTGLNSGDDDCDQVAIGFTFPFFGVDYTQVWVNSNGNLTFDACNTTFSPTPVPDPPKLLVATLYGDFDPTLAGDVFYKTVGAPGFRVFVVTWSGIPEFAGDPDDTNTFQVMFFEETGQIQFGYNGLTTDGINWTSTPMNVGLSNGVSPVIHTAHRQFIPALDQTNVCYTPIVRQNGRDSYAQSRTDCGQAPGDGGEEGFCPVDVESLVPTVTGTEIFGVVFFVGTSGDDVAIGTPDKRNVFVMLGGDDIGIGADLEDLFHGGTGDDTWCGFGNTDWSFGNEGSDLLVGGGGSDRNDGGHTPVPSSDIDEDFDTCFGEANYLCEESHPDE